MSSVPSQFSIYDLFALWIPGAFITVAIWMLILEYDGGLALSTSQIVVAAALVGVVAGCVIQCVAKYIDRLLNYLFGFPSNNYLTPARALNLKTALESSRQFSLLKDESDFFKAWVWVTEHAASDRAQRFYANSMLHRGLAVAMVCITAFWAFIASFSLLGTACVLGLGLAAAALLYIRARAFQSHYVKDVYFRFLLHSGGRHGH